MKYGLDFGTTNSSIAVEENGVGKVLQIDAKATDQRVVRTLLYFNRREIEYAPYVSEAKIKQNIFEPGDYKYVGEFHPLIGQAAVNQYLKENKNRTQGIKRILFTGRMISAQSLMVVSGGADAVREYFEEIDYGTGRLIQGIKTALKARFYKGTTVFGQFMSLEDLVAIYIKEIRNIADTLVVQDVDEVICGRPVHFSDDPDKDKAAQDRLEEGLRQAGFKKITFQFEPIAAAHQFIAQSGKKANTVFVFDFGGGTLDTAIVKGEQVLAADGVYIGGDLLNADIVKAKLWSYFGADARYGEHQLHMPTHIFEALGSWFALPNMNNPETLQLFERLRYKNNDYKALDRYLYLIRANVGFQLYEAIENAKKKLSVEDRAQIIFKDGPIEIDIEITKQEFEEIIKPRVDEIRGVVLRTLDKAKVKPEQIDVVVRTGGSSLIPIFEKMLVDIFGKQKIQQFETFTSIAAGLALE